MATLRPGRRGAALWRRRSVRVRAALEEKTLPSRHSSSEPGRRDLQCCHTCWYRRGAVVAASQPTSQPASHLLGPCRSGEWRSRSAEDRMTFGALHVRQFCYSCFPRIELIGRVFLVEKPTSGEAGSDLNIPRLCFQLLFRGTSIIRQVRGTGPLLK